MRYIPSTVSTIWILPLRGPLQEIISGGTLGSSSRQSRFTSSYISACVPSTCCLYYLRDPTAASCTPVCSFKRLRLWLLRCQNYRNFFDKSNNSLQPHSKKILLTITWYVTQQHKLCFYLFTTGVSLSKKNIKVIYR